MSDEALLAGMAIGDEDSAVHFVRRHQRSVYGLAVRIVRDRRVAEDVAQNAFVRAWQQASSFDIRRGSVATWLLAITRNLSIDELRKRRIDLVTWNEDDADASQNLLAANPSEHIVAREDLRGVARTIDRLPVGQRRALLLSTWHGCTAAQIAHLEGIPLGTAKTRIRTALLRLREAHPDARRSTL